MNCAVFMVDCRENSANPINKKVTHASENGQDGKEKRHPEDLRREIDEGEITASEPAAVPRGTDLEAAAAFNFAASQRSDQGR